MGLIHLKNYHPRGLVTDPKSDRKWNNNRFRLSLRLGENDFSFELSYVLTYSTERVSRSRYVLEHLKNKNAYFKWLSSKLTKNCLLSTYSQQETWTFLSSTPFMNFVSNGTIFSVDFRSHCRNVNVGLQLQLFTLERHHILSVHRTYLLISLVYVHLWQQSERLRITISNIPNLLW